MILAIETSCDDTSVAIVDQAGFVLGQLSRDQNKAHAVFGGVVPEIASRNHSAHILPLIEELFQKLKISNHQIEGIAVTSAPGLIGSLLPGVATAKSLALAWQKPLIGVHHLEGHLLAPLLKDAHFAPPRDFTFPYIALTVSGGHTSLFDVRAFGEYKLLGRTLDDAAGEAFDKIGKALGLPFPAGSAVDELAKSGDASRFRFPRAMMKEAHLNFSFSGLKAAALRQLAILATPLSDTDRADVCASVQQAIIDVLIDRLDRATKQIDSKRKRAVITGGVSANSGLRAQASDWAKNQGVQLAIPPLRYCTDNAAMIGLAGIWHLQRGERSDQSLSPSARAVLGEA